MRKRRQKSFFNLTPEERDREVARFDREIDLSDTRPLTKREKALHEKASRKKSKHRFSFEMDPKLVHQAGQLAKSKGIPLSQLIEQGVRGMLATQK